MEKRAVIAIAISFFILLGWSWIFPPPKKEAPPATTDTSAVEQRLVDDPVQRDFREERELPREGVEEVEDQPALAAVGREQIEIENRFFTAVLTNEGGRATSWKLKDYQDDNGNPLELITSYTDNGHYPLAFALSDTRLAEELNQALFEVKRIDVGSKDGLGRGQKVLFNWSDGRGLSATKTFTFWETNWLVDVEVEVVDRGRPISTRLALGPGFTVNREDTAKTTYYYAGQAAWNLNGNVTRKKTKKLVDAPGQFSGNVNWAGLEDQYFTSLIVPRGGPVDVGWSTVSLTSPTQDDDDAEAQDQPLLWVSIPEEGAQLYIGPKDYRTLKGLKTNQLETAIWFATNSLLYTIAKYIFLGLIWIQSHITSNYGLAIILATLALRILLFPVNQYSMVSMKKAQIQMSRLQPKINAIKSKYKKAKDAASRQKMQQETMDLYKREGVNPMGGVAGCLPMLAQFPILIGFYSMLTVAIELRGAPFFGWIQDLSLKDPFYVIPILMAGTMFLQQKLAMTKAKDPMQAQQQKMMMFMPLVFGFICLQMPAGMVLYWFFSNLMGIGQQWLVNRHTGKLEAAAQKA